MATDFCSIIDGIRKEIIRSLETGPKTIKEISQETNIAAPMIQSLMHDLLIDKCVRYNGGRPMVYSKAEKTIFTMPAREEWKGSPMPYTRPGSYSPPEKPRVCMVSKANYHSDYVYSRADYIRK